MLDRHTLGRDSLDRHILDRHTLNRHMLGVYTLEEHILAAAAAAYQRRPNTARAVRLASRDMQNALHNYTNRAGALFTGVLSAHRNHGKIAANLIKSLANPM